VAKCPFNSFLLTVKTSDFCIEICNECKCPWSTHKHITYEYRTYLTSIDIPLIINDPMNQSNRSASTSSQSLSSDQHVSPTEFAINIHIINLRKELLTIFFVCAKLSRFLRANAITPYNDDIIEYIKHIINEEEIRHQAGTQNSEVIRGLETSREAYELQMGLIEEADNIIEMITHDGAIEAITTDGVIEAIKTNGTIEVTIADDILKMAASDNKKEIPKLHEIFLLVESLYTLPINGEKIRQQVESLKSSQTTHVQHREQIIQLPPSSNLPIIIDRLKKTLV
jgi:hypothetical protein